VTGVWSKRREWPISGVRKITVTALCGRVAPNNYILAKPGNTLPFTPTNVPVLIQFARADWHLATTSGEPPLFRIQAAEADEQDNPFILFSLAAALYPLVAQSWPAIWLGRPRKYASAIDDTTVRLRSTTKQAQPVFSWKPLWPMHTHYRARTRPPQGEEISPFPSSTRVATNRLRISPCLLMLPSRSLPCPRARRWGDHAKEWMGAQGAQGARGSWWVRYDAFA